MRMAMEMISRHTSSMSLTELRPRSIPLLRESSVPVRKLAESLWLEWLRPPLDYFEFRTPSAFEAVRQPCAAETAPGVWQIARDGARGAVLTYDGTVELDAAIMDGATRAAGAVARLSTTRHPIAAARAVRTAARRLTAAPSPRIRGIRSVS